MLALFCLAVAQQRLLPIDEGASDPQFAVFRRNLIASLELKNYDWVMIRLDPEIHFSFGMGPGIAEFEKFWAEKPVFKEEFFVELLKCMKLGGQFKTHAGVRSFQAPYVFSAWPDHLDAFEHVAVTSQSADVYDSPTLLGTRLATVGHTILKTEPSTDRPAGWRCVRLDSGRLAWIEERHVRSPIDYRAAFVKKHGWWVITMFIAGD